MSEKRIVVNKAPWTLQETIPIIVLYACAVLSLIGGFLTEVIVPALGIIGAVAAGGIATYVLTVSAGRKKKSTLIAELHDDKDLTIEVVMVNPQQHKWRNKLDRGNNIVKLSRMRSVKFDKILGTRIMTIQTGGGKNLYLPLRLAEMEEIKDYLGLAVAQNSKIKFDKKEWAEEFTSYVNIPEDKDAEEFFSTAEVIEEEVIEEVDQEPLPEGTYAPVEPLEAPEKVKNAIRLSYDRFRRKSTSEAIGDALEQIDLVPADEIDSPKPVVSDFGSFNLPDDAPKNSSIVIDLGNINK